MNRPPIFLIGCMRSGTTLLSRVLSAHPQIVLLGLELLDVWTEHGAAPCEERCEHRNASHFSATAQAQMTDFFETELKRSRSLRKHLGRAYRNLLYGYSRISYDWENAIALNKSPHLMNKVGYVNALFPNAHFIFILRDIFAHSASQKYLFEYGFEMYGRQRYVPDDENACWFYEDNAELSGTNVYPGNFQLIPEMWLRLNRLALSEIDKIEPERVSLLTYENLVKDQKTELIKLYSQLPLMEEYQGIISMLSERVIRNKNTTTKGDSLTKWQQQLNIAEKEAIDRVIRANKTDYETITDRFR